MSKVKGYVLRSYNSPVEGNDDTNIYAAIAVNSPIILSYNKRSWSIQGSGDWERKIDKDSYDGCLKGIEVPTPKDINDCIPVFIDLEEKTCEEITPDHPDYKSMMKDIVRKGLKVETLKPGNYWMVVSKGGLVRLTNKNIKPERLLEVGWTYNGSHIPDYWIEAETEFPDVAFPVRSFEDEPLQIQITGNTVTWYK